MNAENDMKLPDGKTCADCAYYKRCWALFECPADNTECDWAPSRFRRRVTDLCAHGFPRPCSMCSECVMSPLGYEHAITVGWNEHNARRHELIQAKRSRLLSESEITELAELQWLAGIKRELQAGPASKI